LQKLNIAQKRYKTTDSELLSVIETFKEYKNIMLDYHLPILVFTDHKRNTFNGLKASDYVLDWLFVLEEYEVTFEYLTGKNNKNVLVDALSRLDINRMKIQEQTGEVSKLFSRN
jgi:hypothetical protein